MSQRADDLWEELHKASLSVRRDPFYCVDCSIAVRMDETHAYLIPYGENFIIEHLEPPEHAVDYAYWNNTDQPDNVTDDDWRRRGKTWDRLTEGDTAVPTLVFTSVDMNRNNSHRSSWDLRILAIGRVREEEGK